MLKVNKWWFIAAYVVAMILFVAYVFINREAMLDSWAHNLPAGANSQMFIVGNVLALIAARVYAEGENRRRILRSLALYAFISAGLFLLLPAYMGAVAGCVLFVLTGLYHTRFVDEEKLFSFLGEDRSESSISGEQAKYLLWGAISLMVFFAEYWNI